MDFTTITTDLFPIVLPILVALVTVVGKYFWTRLPENQHAIILSVAQTAVQAVEQQHPNSLGSDKRVVAENIIVDILAAMHVKVAPALIDSAIESAVYVLNNQNTIYQPVPPTTPAPAAAQEVQRIQGAA